jgi:tRNA U54 and U55 pseudouridine synthase Pus10
MQAVAEEKRKGYRCVIWSAQPVTAEALARLEGALTIHGTDTKTTIDTQDEKGDIVETPAANTMEVEVEIEQEIEPYLQIIQKTPLRVLHRRALLDRPRRIFQLKTSKLNDHFFLLDLVTSAGTYVKEFVHSDCGRTSPSVRSLLASQCMILQLDVVKLFDDFKGGGKSSND